MPEPIRGQQKAHLVRLKTLEVGGGGGTGGATGTGGAGGQTVWLFACICYHVVAWYFLAYMWQRLGSATQVFFER